MNDLNNVVEARRLVESLLPEVQTRRVCLSMFADCVQEANLYGPESWCVMPAFDDHIWLVTGELVTCSLVENRIWFSLDRRLMETQEGEGLVCDGSATNWVWEPVDLDNPDFEHQPTFINGFYTPAENHAQIWPQLRRLVNESIYRTIMSPNGYQMEKVHSPALVEYIWNELTADN